MREVLPRAPRLDGQHFGRVGHQVRALEEGDQHVEDHEHAFFLVVREVGRGRVGAQVQVGVLEHDAPGGQRAARFSVSEESYLIVTE